jgi:(p)ppGpp synthase/HD superfamily hydrolase
MSGRRRSPTPWERLPQVRSAAVYAARKHAGQRRSDGTPFIQHPREVAGLLYDAGAAGRVIAAGLLHDVLEKASVGASELDTRFGPEITALVVAVSDDPRIHGYVARKAALRHQVADAGDEALAVFAADKISKLRELEREATVGPRVRTQESRARRLQNYERSLAMLQERLPTSPLVHELSDELASLLGKWPESGLLVEPPAATPSTPSRD